MRPQAAPTSPAQSAGLAEGLGIELKTAPQVLWRVVRLAMRYRWRFTAVIVSSLVATLFQLAAPKLLGHGVDQVQSLLRDGGHDRHAALLALGVTGLTLLFTSSARGLTQMVCGFNSETLGQLVGRDLRLAFFEKLQRLGFDFHDRIHSGELITRGMLDLEGTRGFIEMGLQRIIALAMLVVIGAAGLLMQDPIMAVVTLSFIPFSAWRAGRMGLLLRLAWTQLQRQLAVVTRVMEENLQGAKVVRAFAAHAHEMAKFDVAGDEALRLSNTRFGMRARGSATIASGYYLAMAAVLAVGGRRVASGAITIGQLTECLAYMTLLQLPVRQVAMIMNSAARAISSGRRVFEVLDKESVIQDAPGAVDFTGDRPVLRFEHVSFSYDAAQGPVPVLRDVSFTVRPGKTLGIVGPSGSGKTTIAQLIPRFYDVTGGRITLDGQDIRDLTLASLRKAVNLVSQDVFLFDDSFERNIAYAEPEAEEGILRGAAETAHIHEHIDSLPGGYDTMIGERGANLSGGQRQRASIARALVADSGVLIFDDATSAVDAATEHSLRRALTQATQNLATIIISHRLSSLMHADEIIVIDQGRVIERGDHDALLAAGGYYARLYDLQTLGGVPAAEPVKERVA